MQPIVKKITGISEMKFLLILGVVLIHCNLCIDYPSTTLNTGLSITNWVSSCVCMGIVPVFFLISAYLIFNGVTKFTVSIYAAKLKRRVHTLLVPYLLWCTFCAVLLFVKHQFFNMSGLGIFLDNGEIDWYNFIKGFWIIESAENMPFAFAFWFIRNLIVFVILSPVAWFIGSRYWLTALMFCLNIFFDIGFYGFEWFVAGTFLASHNFYKPVISGKKMIIIACVLIGSSAALQFCSDELYSAVAFIKILSTLLTACYLSDQLLKVATTHKFMRLLIDSTFMIYAVHQCFCSLMRRSWESICGVENVVTTLITYSCCFLSLVLASFLAYLALRRISPRFLYLITGGRL